MSAWAQPLDVVVFAEITRYICPRLPSTVGMSIGVGMSIAIAAGVTGVVVVAGTAVGMNSPTTTS
jgi:hypothetical protein